MKILILCASLPYPLTSGGAIRTFGIIKGLAEALHEITLLAYGEPPEEQSPLYALCQQIETVPPPQRSKMRRLSQLLFSSQPDIASRLYSVEFEEKLLAILANTSFDLIQFEAIEIACFMPHVKRLQTHALICFDTFNAEANLQQVIYEIDRQDPGRLLAAAYSYIQSKRIYRYEGDLCRIADLILAVSKEDADLLSQYEGHAPVKIISSGIYVDDYQERSTISLPSHSLVFTGKMDYRPNVDAMLWFSDTILPQVPQAHLTIVGQQPHSRIQHLTQNPHITITGWVESVVPYLKAADVYIAPLRMGSGTRLKLLEALAAGCAIVATSIAAAGLAEPVKEAMIIADTEKDFQEAICMLLQHPDQREQLSVKGRESVRKYYDWSVLIPQLIIAYQEAGLG